METQIVKMKAVKETKNTIKYEELPLAGHPPVIGVLYVQKWWAGTEASILTVTLEKGGAK